MERKLKIVLWIIGCALLATIFYFLLSPQPLFRPILKLTEDKLITNQTLRELILEERKSPLGNNLSEMVLQNDYLSRGVMDGAYKVAYYVCVENEHQGWIYYSNGEGTRANAKLYGPYDWCLI